LQEGRIPQGTQDDYDHMVLELANEVKAKPSDRMKTAEEIAREERDRLQELEEARLRRMRGEPDKAEAGADAAPQKSKARLEVGSFFRDGVYDGRAFKLKSILSAQPSCLFCSNTPASCPPPPSSFAHKRMVL
jgi:hypothetical protein